jgi:hypothetical protein
MFLLFTPMREICSSFLLFVPGSGKGNEFHREFTVSRRDGATASSQ